LCDAGSDGPAWNVSDVAEALGVSSCSIEHLKKRFVEEGLEAALERKAREKPPRDIIFDGAFEARLVALACSDTPEGNAAFVECMDEPCKQLIGEVRKPMPCVPGKPERMDDEYVRNGVVEIFMEVEPLAGKRHVAITEHRTRKDWAMQIRQMLDERYPSALKVRLVMDNLKTHTIASLYETFKPGEARRLAERLDIHYRSKHGSWLNMAEIELSVLKGQCLNRLIPDITTMRTEVAAWEKDRNNSAKNIVWQFTTPDARIKLKRLYPKL